MTNKYKKIVALDDKINSLKRMIEDISKGSSYTDGSIIGSPNFYMTVSATVKSDWGSYQYRNETVEYNILASTLIYYIRNEISALKEERMKLVNPWYKRLFS